MANVDPHKFSTGYDRVFNALPKIKIIKHIFNKTTGHGGLIQRFVVLNRLPEFKYVREGDLLLAEDGGFYSCHKYSAPTKWSAAFAGRGFTLTLEDGGAIQAKGQWWDALHPEHKKTEMCGHGHNTLEGLSNCYAYYSGYFKKDLLLTCTEEPVDYRDFEKELRNRKGKK